MADVAKQQTQQLLAAWMKFQHVMEDLHRQQMQILHSMDQQFAQERIDQIKQALNGISQNNLPQ